MYNVMVEKQVYRGGVLIGKIVSGLIARNIVRFRYVSEGAPVTLYKTFDEIVTHLRRTS
jgi:hypothetical protein